MIRKHLNFSIKSTYTGMCGNISFYLKDCLLLWNQRRNDITDIKINYIFINCTYVEHDNKEIAFFHKAHLYWDVWKYFILPVRLLITLEWMTKQYYRYKKISFSSIAQIWSL